MAMEQIFNIPVSEIFSFIGLCLITFAVLPQILKTLSTKDTAAISLKMYIMYSMGCIFMMSYGLMVGSYSIIFWEVISLTLSLIITYMKLMNVIKKGEDL